MSSLSAFASNPPPQAASGAAACDLCALPLPVAPVIEVISDIEYRFCCIGCRQVFGILMAASAAPEPPRFRDTPLFKSCMEIGLISSERKAAAVFGKSHLLPLSLKIAGMWCPACAWLISETLLKSPGVAEASCNFSTDRLHCRFDPVATTPDRIRKAVDRLGYRAFPPGEKTEEKEKRREMIRLIVSALLTMNVMMLSFALYSGFFTTIPPDMIRKLSWPIFAMSGIVLFYGGSDIHRKALAGIASGNAGMEALISLGAFSAFIYSLFRLLSESLHLYFDTAAMIVTLMLVGKIIERKAKERIVAGLESIYALRPTKVRIERPDHPAGRYLSADALKSGDLFISEEGEIIPADGWIVAGVGAIDESAMTGEPLPVGKRKGDFVRSGAKVVEGRFRIRAERVGTEATLGQLIRITESALAGKIPLETQTDRLLRLFVPAVLILAAMTGLVVFVSGGPAENALIRGLTVLVVSCPCALGIAIPMARTAGVSAAAGRGILVRDFSAFEKAGRITSFLFDKTGTLTRGDWRLLDVIPSPPFTRRNALSLALGLEAGNGHVIAREIRRVSGEERVRPAGIERIQTHDNGVSGRFGRRTIRIGSRVFACDAADSSPPGAPESEGRSEVFMTLAGRPCARFIFGDSIRPSSRSAVSRLKERGYRLAVFSGDGEAATRAAARHLGISDFFSRRLPGEKARLVQVLRDSGERVAVVGDGVNDAPALANGDLAVAVLSGNHLEKEVADISLMRSEPGQILLFLDLAERVRKKIDQNLFGAFIYNFVALPLAMAGLLNPPVAVAAMLLSSLTVIGNSLTLSRIVPEEKTPVSIPDLPYSRKSSFHLDTKNGDRPETASGCARDDF